MFCGDKMAPEVVLWQYLVWSWPELSPCDVKRSKTNQFISSLSPGAVPNAGPLQTYNELTDKLLFDAFWLHRAVTLPMPNTVLNSSVNQPELLKIFHSHQLRAPKTAGPGAAAPLASH